MALVLGACDDPPPPVIITPPPSDFDPVIATAAVGTIPGDANVTPDGTFTYAMPIEVPPGRAGMQPSLAITYTSSETETALGVGFSLSGLSAITRCPRTIAQDGERRDVELTSDDRLCVDGQRLVLETGTYGAPGATYGTEEDELLSVIATGEPGWPVYRVRAPDGHVRTYGNALDNVVFVGNRDASDNVIETWLLAREEDAQGNTIDYEYSYESPPPPVFGSDAVSVGIAVRPQVRIAAIHYTGRAGTSTRGNRSVRFVYSAAPRYPPVGSCEDFPADPGVSTSALCAPSPEQWAFARGTAALRASSRPLERIETYVGDALVSAYRLRGSDAPASHLYRLDQIDHCVVAPAASDADADPDEPNLVCMPPTRFTWRDREVIVRPNGIRDGETDPRYDLPTFQRYDAFWDRLEAVNSFICDRDDLTGAPLACDFYNPVIALDVNGDGADDVAYRFVGVTPGVARGQLTFRLGRPVSRDTASLPETAVPFSRRVLPRIRSEVPGIDLDDLRVGVLNTVRVPVVDWNADGLDDLLYLRQGAASGPIPEGTVGFLVLESEPCSTGDPCTEAEPVRFLVRDTGFRASVEVGGNGDVIRGGMARYSTADMNGDGRQDVVACVLEDDCPLTRSGEFPGERAFEACPAHWAIALRTNEGFDPLVHSTVRTECLFEYDESYLQHFDFFDGDDPAQRLTDVEVGDFDGDGRQELLIAPDYFEPFSVDAEGRRHAPPRRILRWDGTSLVASVAEFIPSYGVMTAVDVNGDGMHDLFGDLLVNTPDVDRPTSILALATGVGFVADYVTIPMPDRRRTRLRFQGGVTDPRRQIMSILPFDINRDGRGDFLVPTLDADATMVQPVPGLPLGHPQWTWGEERAWIAEVLSPAGSGDFFHPAASSFYAYPTNADLGRTEYLESSGSSFVNPTLITHERLLVDGDGDGNLDLLDVPRRFPDDTLVPLAPTRFFHNVRGEAPLLERIEDGMGVLTEVGYRNLSDPDVYTPSHDCAYPVRCVTDSREVVHELRRDDGSGGFRTTRYRYVDGRVDLTGRGWLGFGRVESLDTLSGALTITNYDNGDAVEAADDGRVRYPLAHRPIEAVSYTYDPTIRGSVRLQGSQTFTAYSVLAVPAGSPGVFSERYRVRVENTFTRAFESTTAPTSPTAPWLSAPTIRLTSTTSSGFDEYGLPAEVRTESGGATTVVQTTYEHDVSAWRIGFPTTTRVTSSTAGVAACDRSVVTTYENDLPAARVVSATRNAGDAETEQRITYGYDPYGNVSEIHTEAAGEDGEPERRTETVFWDAQGYFPVEVVNAAGHVSTVAFDPRHGHARAAVDPNWVESRSYIDGFGRPRATESDLGDRVKTTYLRELAGVFRVETSARSGAHAAVETDRLGRLVRAERTHAFRTVLADATYDARGRVSAVSEPHDLGTSAVRSTRFVYDGLDRLRRVVNAENERTDFVYGVNRVHRRNHVGHLWTSEHDLLGHVVRQFEPSEEGRPAGGVTSYGRCAGGETYRIVDTVGHVTEMTYDALGRRTALDDPDTGEQSFRYDGWDELVETTDAADRVTRFIRDELGRLTERQDLADGLIARWEYDTAPLEGRQAIGLLARALSGDGVVDEYAYDELARPVEVTRSFADLTDVLSVAQRYDALSRVSEVRYPSLAGDGVRVAYDYDDGSGELLRVRAAEGIPATPYWELLNQDVHGLPTSEAVGPATRTSAFTPSGRPLTVVTRAPGTRLQHLIYRYNNRGLLRQRQDVLARRTERFVHDALGRLSTVTEGTTTTESYDYDVTGNLLATHDATLTYPSGAFAERPHGVTDYESASGELWSAAYDDVGNVTDLGDLHLTYNQRNLPRTATDGDTAASFQYDAEGGRALKAADGELTAYFGGYELRRVGLVTEERTVIATPSGPVAQVEVVSTGLDRVEQTRWLFTDRQGSVETAWLDGEAPQHFRYDAFGGIEDAAGEVTGEAPSESIAHGYTGHEHDDELGLVNMNGRIYHPRLRRFMSADPLTTGVGQGLNRYSYVRNSPHNLIDPTGFQGCDGGLGAVECGQRFAPIGSPEEAAERTARTAAATATLSPTPPSNYVTGTVEPWGGGGDPGDGGGETEVGDGTDSTAEDGLLATLDRVGLRDPLNLLAAGAGFGSGVTVGAASAYGLGLALASPAAPVVGALLVVGAVVGGVYVATHWDGVSSAFMEPYHDIARGEATPSTYFEAMFLPGTVIGGAAAGPGASSAGAGLGEFLFPAAEGTASAVFASAAAGATAGGTSAAGIDGAVAIATTGSGGAADPGLAAFVSRLEAAGIRVTNTNMRILGPTGATVGEVDAVTQNALIQYKSGPSSAFAVIRQVLERTAPYVSRPVVTFIDDTTRAGARTVSGASSRILITNDFAKLVELLR